MKTSEGYWFWDKILDSEGSVRLRIQRSYCKWEPIISHSSQIGDENKKRHKVSEEGEGEGGPTEDAFDVKRVQIFTLLSVYK